MDDITKRLAEALRALINRGYTDDDGQAFKEAQKFLDSYENKAGV